MARNFPHSFISFLLSFLSQANDQKMTWKLIGFFFTHLIFTLLITNTVCEFSLDNYGEQSYFNTQSINLNASTQSSEAPINSFPSTLSTSNTFDDHRAVSSEIRDYPTSQQQSTISTTLERTSAGGATTLSIYDNAQSSQFSSSSANGSSNISDVTEIESHSPIQRLPVELMGCGPNNKEAIGIQKALDWLKEKRSPDYSWENDTQMVILAKEVSQKSSV